MTARVESMRSPRLRLNHAASREAWNHAGTDPMHGLEPEEDGFDSNASVSASA
jgi:hypothetical protein